jgi:hypothetical protein
MTVLRSGGGDGGVVRALSAIPEEQQYRSPKPT